MADSGVATGLWDSSTVQSALLVVAAGLVVTVIQHGLLPLKRHRARGLDLQTVGIRRTKPGSGGIAAERSAIEWVVPVPPGRLLPMLRTRLSTSDVRLESESAGLRLLGRPDSHWNPNRVKPTGFEDAGLRVEAAGGGESRVIWRVRAGGEWRSTVSTVGFVAIGSALCLVGERGRAAAPVVIPLLLGFGLMGLLFRRRGQASMTQGWIEELLVEACREVASEEVVRPGSAPTASGISRA